MLRKILWMVILLAMTACTILLSEGGEIIINDPTSTPVVCDNCTSIPTEIIEATATVEPTGQATEVVELTATQVSSPTSVSTSTGVPTSTVIPPTATATSLPPTATTTSIPPTATNTSVPPTATRTSVPSPTATSVTFTEVYAVQPATPVFMENFVHTAEGCAWQGVAGQVFDASGKPVTNLIVRVSGVWAGKGVSLVGITGMVSGLPYGPGSYEIVLGTATFDTVDALQIQVFSADQKPLTNPLSFSTSADCSKNLVIVNFKSK